MLRRTRAGAWAATLALAALFIGCTDGGERSGSQSSSVEERRAGLDSAAALPEARTEVAGARWRSSLVVVGGLRIDGSPTPRVDIYDPGADRWRSGPDLPVPLHHTGLAVLGDRLWVAGGYSGVAQSPWVEQAAVYSLGAEETNWRTETALPAPVGALGIAAVGDTLVVFGGARQGRQLTETWTLKGGGDRWTRGPDLRQAREHLAGAAADGRVYAIAGRVGGLDTNLQSVESWSPGDPTWRQEPELVQTRGGIAADVVGDRLCVAGGEEPSGTIASVECLSDDGWKELIDLRSARHGLAVIAHENRLHVIGGGDQPGLFVSTAHEVLTLADH